MGKERKCVEKLFFEHFKDQEKIIWIAFEQRVKGNGTKKYISFKFTANLILKILYHCKDIEYMFANNKWFLNLMMEFTFAWYEPYSVLSKHQDKTKYIEFKQWTKRN